MANPSTYEEITELFDLLSDIYDHQWKGGADCWEWKGDKNDMYTVKKAKKLISKRSMAINSSNMTWAGWTPLKCKIMVWRADLNRLPTRV